MLAALIGAAIEAQRAGICILPAAADGSKRPAVAWKRFQTVRPTDDELRTWYGEPYDGIGFVCGAVSGHLEMLEFEAEAIADGTFTAFCERAIEDGLVVVAAIIAGYQERTPSGGIHWLYRCAEPIEGNQKLASKVTPDGEIKVLVETRGEGGWVVVAPSGGRTHPNGESWTLEHGGIGKIATISAAERKQLLELARSFDLLAKREPAAAPLAPQMRDENEKPGTKFNREHTWREILEPAGWTFLYESGGESYWRRPGKNEGISATTNYEGTDLLKVFSTSTPFSTEKTYDRFGAFAQLHHEGDFSAAGRAVRPPEPERPLSALLGAPKPAEAVQGDPEPYDEWAGSMIDWSVAWDKDRSQDDWLIEPFLIKGRGHALFAPGKTGKSLLVLEAAAALATGKSFLGKPAGEPAHVLYLDYEMTERDVMDRLEEMGFGPNDDLSHLHYALVSTLEPLDTAEGGVAVLKKAKELGVDLVVVDTTARAVIGDEDKSDTFRALYRCTFALLKAAGIAACRVDHAGKDLKKGQRGSSAKADDVDVVLQLTANADLLKLRCTAQRVGYVPQETLLRRFDEPLRHELVIDAVEGTAVGRLVKDLDRLGVPLDASNRQVRDLLRNWNLANAGDEIRARNDTIALALRIRKSDEAKRSVADLIGHESALKFVGERVPVTDI